MRVRVCVFIATQFRGFVVNNAYVCVCACVCLLQHNGVGLRKMTCVRVCVFITTQFRWFTENDMCVSVCVCVCVLLRYLRGSEHIHKFIDGTLT